MSDLLAAASLLLTVVAVLYGLWYSEIARVLDIRPNPHPEDNRAYVRDVRNIVRGRARPLVLAAATVVVVFAPDALRTISRSLSRIGDGHYRYDAVSTAFVLVVLLSSGLCAHSIRLLWQLRSLRIRLESGRSSASAPLEEGQST